MDQSSFLRVCKSCGQDFAKSVKECPHCGKKVQSGRLLMLIIGLGCLALAGAFAIPMGKDQPDDMKMVAVSPAERLDTAELASLFNDRKMQSSHRVQQKAQEITGKIVQWELEVFAVTKSADCYQVLTKPTKSAPGTLLTLFPRNSQQQGYLDNLRAGFNIRIKGRIAGFEQGRIKINPAFLL